MIVRPGKLSWEEISLPRIPFQVRYISPQEAYPNQIFFCPRYLSWTEISLSRKPFPVSDFSLCITLEKQVFKMKIAKPFYTYTRHNSPLNKRIRVIAIIFCLLQWKYGPIYSPVVDHGGKTVVHRIIVWNIKDFIK